MSVPSSGPRQVQAIASLGLLSSGTPGRPVSRSRGDTPSSDDPKGARGRSTARLSPTSHATQSSSRGSLDDQPPHTYPATARTATLRHRSANTMTRNEGQTSSSNSSGTKTRSEESKQTPGSTSTRRTMNTSSQSQEGRGTVDLASSRSENSSRDPAQSTASRTTGDASGPTTP